MDLAADPRPLDRWRIRRLSAMARGPSAASGCAAALACALALASAISRRAPAGIALAGITSCRARPQLPTHGKALVNASMLNLHWFSAQGWKSLHGDAWHGEGLAQACHRPLALSLFRMGG